MGSVKGGVIVHLDELQVGSPFFHPGSSIRAMGRLMSYEVDSGIAVISEDEASLRVNTEFLQGLHFRTGSLYQFIGELTLIPGSMEEMVLQARVGRNVDGLDLKLYNKALELRRRFEAKYMQD